jgi:hypothetical protein
MLQDHSVGSDHMLGSVHSEDMDDYVAPAVEECVALTGLLCGSGCSPSSSARA